MKHDKKILIVEDDQNLNLALQKAFEQQGYSVLTAKEAATAKEKLSSGTIDLALIDVHLPGEDGMEVLNFAQKETPQTICIVSTAMATVEKAVEAMRQGAFHFLKKPFDLREVLNLVDKALTQAILENENFNLRQMQQNYLSFDKLIGKSQSFLETVEMVRKLTLTDSALLISGERGTGKELISKTIHAHSSRKARPFFTIDCGAFSSQRLESELLGHTKGAFLTANAHKKGTLEKAAGGTVLLKGIEFIEPPLQVKILKALKEKQIQKIGSDEAISIDVRIMTATQEKPSTLIEKHNIREDFYYGFHVVSLHLLPLRQRAMDIPLLVNFFLKIFNEKHNKSVFIEKEVMELFLSYNWPGNIQELRDLIEKLVTMNASGAVYKDSLPLRFVQNSFKKLSTSSLDIPTEGIDFNEVLKNYEKELLLRALKKTKWNRNRAAQLLKINRTTLIEKLKKKGLRPPESST